MWIQYKKRLKQTELKVGVVQSYGKDCSLRALCHWTSSPGCQISYLYAVIKFDCFLELCFGV